jgi:phosphatidylglycerol:prolipoprotein diacylglycerol transferase
MHQVLFHVPLFTERFPPDGIPVYGFGAMLFITFVACTWWATRRGKGVGLGPERVQDMAIVLFISGIVGARVLYMIQYANQFPDKSLLGLAAAFFQIWKGGIIFYGSALGGAIGYGLFYWYVLRRLRISGWRLADAVAPILCLGLAIGRIGCYLNGCCWGQVACEETCPVPLGAAHFPLLPAHARDQLVLEKELQTSAGFAIATRSRLGTDDPRSVVVAVEPGSPATAAGLRPGDKIVKVNGQPNAIVAGVSAEGDGTPEQVKAALDDLRKHGARVEESPDHAPRAYFDDYAQFSQAIDRVRQGTLPVRLTATDYLWDLARDWPRGRNDITLGVERKREGGGTEVIDLPAFTPRTVGLYPTQLYETVSMLLLILLLLAYYPYRRHDGQLLSLCMIGYAIHRFVNESIRIEPTVGGTPLTLSQWGSVVIFVAAVVMEAYLWRVMPSRWATTPAPVPAPGAAGATS